ncbi:unnamed protein product, partial [Mesorhabditis spiculigera]
MPRLPIFLGVFTIALAVPLIEPPNRISQKMSEPEARKVWKSLGPGDAVCIDIDQTLRKDNVFQELGRMLGMFEAIEKITNLAMSGSFSHADSMRMRLNMMNISRAQYEQFLKIQMNSTKEHLAPGGVDLIAALKKKGIDVYLVGGGFRENANNLADYLGISRDHTFSHDLVFDANGNYKDLDVSGVSDGQGHHGKSNLLRVLKAERNIKKLVMLGDATIDMVACPPADLCIGYGKFYMEPLVKAMADWYLIDMEELIRAL